ncbi:hypothetical protein C2S52_020613 [Perilla frutescens var. hirtella]|nr:hypothetical protein C2S52_020613 [Perilla frutescens var. hirtella]
MMLPECTRRPTSGFAITTYQRIIPDTKVAYAYRQESFLRYMSMIARNETTYASLLTIGVDHWARSQSPMHRYAFMTSNVAESFNICLLWARRLPIYALIEVVSSMTERWFDKRRKLAVSRDHVITEEAYKKLSKQVEKGRHFMSCQTTAYTYTVTDAERSFVVDLQNHTCDYGEFQLDHMSCSHATTAIRSAGHNMNDYVEYYYKQVNMCLTYHECVYSIPNDDEWTVLFQQASFHTLPFYSGSPTWTTKRRAVPFINGRFKLQDQKTTTHDARTKTSGLSCVASDTPSSRWPTTVVGACSSMADEAMQGIEGLEPELQFKGPMMRLRAKKLQGYLQVLIHKKFKELEYAKGSHMLVNLLTNEDQDHTMENIT